LPIEIVRLLAEPAMAFVREHEREALKTFYDFSVVWHEQTHWFAAEDGGETVGVAQIRIAASLAHVERVIVIPERRRTGLGRALLAEAADTANYYNCHKLTVMVPHRGGAQIFFERCGYHEEAVLPQHTFKMDIAVLRKFLL
jgi:GNAT superfamily N-acetyltransferase